MKTIATTVAVLLAGTTMAFAQDTAAPAGSPATETMPAGTTASGEGGGVSAVSTETMQPTVTFVTPEASDFVVSDLIDEEIENANGESIGTIEDFVIREGKDLTGVIVSVGGFLGMGETYVVVDPNALTIVAEGEGDDTEWNVMMDTDKETLTDAPKFEYTGQWDR